MHLIGTTVLLLSQAQHTEAETIPCLNFSRGDTKPNLITLKCVNDSNTLSVISNVLFFLNGSTDRIPGSPDINGELVFRINRRLEGEYTCGRSLAIQSNPISLIGLLTESSYNNQLTLYSVPVQL